MSESERVKDNKSVRNIKKVCVREGRERGHDENYEVNSKLRLIATNEETGLDVKVNIKGRFKSAFLL